MKRALLVFAELLLLAGTAGAEQPSTPVVALVGGTIVDVRDNGLCTEDIRDGVVLISEGKIAAVGTRVTLAIPAGATVIDATGDFIVPGLVDGYAGMNSQAQANATLYMGVTTIVGSSDDRRGFLKLDTLSGPHVYPIDTVGSQDDYSLLIGVADWTEKLKEREKVTELSPADTERQLVETARRGTRVIRLGHPLTSANANRIIKRSHELGLVTYGEFISTPYADGLADGVDVLLHMSRYEIGLIPPDLQRPLIANPQGDAQDAAYDYLFRFPSTDPAIARYTDRIKASGAVLMPTFSLFYLELPGHRNLWLEPAASVLDPKDLNQPPDRLNGEPKFRNAAVRDHVVEETLHFWQINRTMFAERPVYLAASGAVALGTMPGISMHTELELLVRLGLTPREALASATSNYAARFGWKELGLVEAGRRADLLILSADPTVDITNSRKIVSVFLDGAVVNRDSLLSGAPS